MIKTNELKFCKNCQTMTKLKFGTVKYKVEKKLIRSFQKITCSNCGHERSFIERKYSTTTPVNLITGKYTRKIIRQLKADRAEIDRKVLRHFTKPQLRRYKILSNPKCEYEMIKETPLKMNLMRKIFWSQWNKYGKMSSSWKDSQKQPHLDQIYCKEHQRKESVGIILVGNVNTPVRVCENHWYKLVKNMQGEKVKEYQGVDWTDYIPLEEHEKIQNGYSIQKKKDMHEIYDNFNHEIRNANLKEVKFCGTDMCPNRFQYITRPDKLHELFSEGSIAT